jgi:aflatoxin B1 aldehyde reductase
MTAKMVKVIAGLMGSSVASGSTSMSGAQQLRPFLTMLKQHNVRELDTARVYNAGKSEADLGDVPEAKNDFIVETKAPGFGPGSLSYDNVIKNCNASLQALKQDKIELYYFHGPDRRTSLEESCKAMQYLYNEGKIAKFGVSNFNAKEVEEIHEICTKNSWVLPSVYQGMYLPQN